MRSRNLFIGLRFVLAIFAVAVFAIPTGAAAQQEKVLRSFSAPGAFKVGPYAGLIFDAAGNLYGTTQTGFDLVAFELTPTATGGWAEKILHVFPKGAVAFEPTAGLIFDHAGNLYGATSGGGAFGYGTVFALRPDGSGGWKNETLHNFNKDGTDGYNPEAGLILDSVGNLYGTTARGGTNFSVGTVFEVSHRAGVGWTEKVLYNFSPDGSGKDGAFPLANLIFDAHGNLYGTTAHGGANNSGVVFELNPETGGGWTENVVFSFTNGAVGDGPAAGLILDAGGNLYGTTIDGGTGLCNFEGIVGCGTVFELERTSGGWTEKVLYSFNTGTDAQFPHAGLVFDTVGNLYGTTAGGGSALNCFDSLGNPVGCGTAYELTPTSGGGWTEKVLYSFTNSPDGAHPESSLILDASGNLYGTTYGGGTHSDGTVFKITP